MSFVSPEELNMILARAKSLDKTFTITESPMEERARKFGVDAFATKKKTDDGEFTNGMYFPNSKHLRDPQEVKEWANALHQDVLSAIEHDPEITSEGLFRCMEESHSKLKTYYSFIYKTIASNPIKPPFYINMLNDMCDAQTKIRNGGNVDKIEAELEARFLYYKKRNATSNQTI